MFSSRFLRFFLPITAVVALVLWAGYRQIDSSRMRELRQAEEKYVALLGEALADDFQAVVTDLLVLAYDGELRRALIPATPRLPAGRHRFQRFAEHKKVYDQIRFLDADGRKPCASTIATDRRRSSVRTNCRSKRDRYYFQETMRLAARSGLCFRL